MNNARNFAFATLLAAVSVGGAFATPQETMHQGMGQGSAHGGKMMMEMSTSAFKGVEVNGGMAMLSGRTLKLSPDFMIPKAPAPSWQIVDKQGNVYLLKQLRLAGGKMNRQIMLPGYIKSVAKVQIWCSFAEVLLGEASFAKPVDLR